MTWRPYTSGGSARRIPEPGRSSTCGCTWSAPSGAPVRIWERRRTRPPDAYDHAAQAVVHRPDPGLAGRRPGPPGKVLAVTDQDLFIPILTFVFGEAQLDGAGGGGLDGPARGAGAARPAGGARAAGQGERPRARPLLRAGPLRQPGLRDGALAERARRGPEARRVLLEVPGPPDAGRGRGDDDRREHPRPGGRRRGDRPGVAGRLAAEGRLPGRRPPPTGAPPSR